MKRTLFITPDGKSPIALSNEDEIVMGAAEAFKALNEREFELLAILSGDYTLPLDSIVRRASRKNPLMSIAIIGGRRIADRLGNSLVDVTIEDAADFARIENELARLIEAKRLLTECDLVGKSPEIRAVGELIFRVAPTDLPVLIVGESGTGKELVAKAIHRHSKRSEKRFLPINAAAIAPGTLESELFGHERGSFTGASARHRGFFEQADGGTLFLDEIAELPIPVQAKLLRFLEDKTYLPLGGTEPIKVNARIICATNKDLKELMDRGEFRKDLFFRLNTIMINTPPLRERKEDIAPLVEYFNQRLSKELNRQPKIFSDEVLETFTCYPWPGNVRELRNIVERIFLMSDSTVIDSSDIPWEIINHADCTEGEKVGDVIADAERQLLIDALDSCSWNLTRAAQRLGITRSAIRWRIKKYKLKRPHPPQQR